MLVEEILASKVGLGADYKFDDDTLEVKINANGAKGVFTRSKIPAGRTIIAVPVQSGTLTSLRAYEEASEMLKQLGSSRFNVSQAFVLACAVYQRFHNETTKISDIIVTENDAGRAYKGTPMTASGSEALAKLLQANNRTALEEAAMIESMISQIGVDVETFRALLGYCQSRMWSDYGIIPVLDWLNSSFGNLANCTCNLQNKSIIFCASRIIEPGEELTWQYNDSNRILTWWAYGYIDERRPSAAFLKVQLNPEQKKQFVEFSNKNLEIDLQVLSPSHKLDDCRYDYLMSTPSGVLEGEVLRNQVLSAIRDFVNIRFWFRLRILAADDANSEMLTTASLADHQNTFGVEAERRAVQAMLDSLSLGNDDFRERIAVFKETQVGSQIDVGPIEQMQEGASQEWRDVLHFLIELLSTDQVVSKCVKHFDLDSTCETDLIDALKEIDLKQPTLMVAAVLIYLENFFSFDPSNLQGGVV